MDVNTLKSQLGRKEEEINELKAVILELKAELKKYKSEPEPEPEPEPVPELEPEPVQEQDFFKENTQLKSNHETITIDKITKCFVHIRSTARYSRRCKIYTHPLLHIKLNNHIYIPTDFQAT